MSEWVESDTGPWAAVPSWVIDAEISPRAFKLYAILSLHADGGASGDGATKKTRKQLAARLDCSVDTLDRAVSELEGIGALEKTATKDANGDQGPNKWKLYRVRPGGSKSAAGGGGKDAAVEGTRPSLDPDPQLQGGKQVREVFDAWKTSTGRTSATHLDSKRTRLITAALKNYPLPDVLEAVRGWEHSPYHRGENEHKRTYNDLGLLLRDAEHIERFRDLARTARPKPQEPPTGPELTPEEEFDQWMAEHDPSWKPPSE
jgi:hypothetical protein